MRKNKGKAAQAVVDASARATKIDVLIGLMRRAGGADVKALAAAAGWQDHSVRGAIAGHIKKKLGLPVVAEKVDGTTTYRLEA